MLLNIQPELNNSEYNLIFSSNENISIEIRFIRDMKSYLLSKSQSKIAAVSKIHSRVNIKNSVEL